MPPPLAEKIRYVVFDSVPTRTLVSIIIKAVEYKVQVAPLQERRDETLYEWDVMKSLIFHQAFDMTQN